VATNDPGTILLHDFSRNSKLSEKFAQTVAVVMARFCVAYYCFLVVVNCFLTRGWHSFKILKSVSRRMSA
jgi:hypothetical protein